VCCYIVPKFANYNLCKSSLVGYILIALGLQDKFKMLQASLSPNEVTPGLEEVGWGLVLVCTVGVQPFSNWENCVLLCSSKICEL